ncbi:transcriptional regulator [Streptomyces griseocarneus]|nr:transcriptional regulator [Streptomyces griseocarneus]
MKRRPTRTNAFVFGMLLKHFREVAGLTQEELGKQAHCDRSLIARIEAGTRSPREDLVKRCDALLPTEGALHRLWVEIDWSSQEVEYPDWFDRRVEMEAECTSLHAYSSEVVPGLLQTEDYVRAMFSCPPDATDPATVEERVRARLSRQHRFLATTDPLLMVVLAESCIRNVVQSHEVMHRQCAHLLTVGKRPNIRIQVAPARASNLVRPKNSMSIIRLPNRAEWIYTESLEHGHFSDEPHIVRKYTRAYDFLRADCLSVSDSAELISEAMEGYRRDEQLLDQEQLQPRGRGRLRGNRPRYPRPRRPRA